MEGFLEQQHTLCTADVDFNGEWRTGAIFMAMQEAGSAHCERFGLGVAPMREHNLAWVLARAHLHMERVPVLGETITLRTWPKQPQHFFFPRYYELWANGVRIGCGSTLFAQLELTTRRMAKPWIGDNDRLDCELEPPMPLPGSVPLLTVEAETLRRKASYSDLDINAHVNNTRYVDWFCDCFDTSFHRTHRLTDILIQYNREIVPEADVALSLQNEDDRSVMKGSVDGTVCFSMLGSWSER